jgi:predicted phage tail protein
VFVIIVTSSLETSFECEVDNLLQLIDYLKNNKEIYWNEIKDKKLSYTLAMESGEAQALYPNMLSSTISNYDILVISEKLVGHYGLTAIVTGLLIGIGVGETIAGVAAVVIVAVGYAVLSWAVGQVIQALSPTNSIAGDSSQSQKRYIFNGIPNIKEQGGSIPLFFGEGLFGGLVIGLVIKTIDININDDITVDQNIKSIALVDMKNPSVVTESSWYRIS